MSAAAGQWRVRSRVQAPAARMAVVLGAVSVLSAASVLGAPSVLGAVLLPPVLLAQGCGKPVMIRVENFE